MKERKVHFHKKGCFCYGLIGFWFAFCWKTGSDLAEAGNIVWNVRYTLGTLVMCLIAGILSGWLAAVWYESDVKDRVRGRLPKVPAKWKQMWQKYDDACRRLTPGKAMLWSVLLIVLAWLPVYLAYYPGICAYDCTIQIGQFTDAGFNDHHPIMHTLLIQWAMELGGLLGNVNTGIGIYTAVQMLFLALSMAYGIGCLHKAGAGTGAKTLVQLFCMFYPFHWYMSATMIKDTVFSGFVLVFLATLAMCLREQSAGRLLGRNEILLFLGSVGMVLFRNNGKYALLVPAVLLVLMCVWGRKARKLWCKLLIILGLGLVLGTVLLNALFAGTGAQQGDRREMLSMPIQQFSRSMVYHGGIDVLPEDDHTMPDEYKAYINDFLLNEGYRNYDPHISDPVKNHTNTYAVRYRASEFVETYLALLLRYPGEFINAALEVNAGFLYPGDVSHAEIYHSDAETGMGYAQTRWVENELNPKGIYKDSKWPRLYEKLEKWAGENAHLKWPVVRYLFVPGTFLWLCLWALGDVFYRKDYRMCLPYTLIGGYYLTMFLGPTVQLRYLYPVMLVLPFVVLLCKRKQPTVE